MRYRKILFVSVLCFFLFNKTTSQNEKKHKDIQVKKIPIINITDLYHPYQDPGDNFDLIMGYALPELDLKAIILDITDAFRKPVADHPTLWKDPRGPREAGFIPILQLNYIFDRNIPFALGPLNQMQSENDKMLDLPGFQQEGINLFLKTLRENKEPVEVLSFGSARILAVAYNREPELLRKKIRLIHLSAGTASPDFKLGSDAGANAIPGGEWNVALDVHAFNRLLKSDLQIAIYPCATENGAFALGRNNSYWQLPKLEFIKQMHPRLRRYLDYSFSKSKRIDFLRAMEVDDSSSTIATSYPSPHHVWETALWLNVSQRLLIQRKNGDYAVIPKSKCTKEDRIIPDELKECSITLRQDGRFTYSFINGGTNFTMYDRGNFMENERAMREALPALYLTFLK